MCVDATYYKLPQKPLLFCSLVPPHITLSPWRAPGTALQTTGQSGSGGWDYGQRAHQARIQLPSSRHLGLLCAAAFHTAHTRPLCLLPPGTPAFLIASSSHRSANPPALLTALHQREKDREGERERESERETMKVTE